MSEAAPPLEWMRFAEAVRAFDALFEAAPKQSAEDRLASLMRHLDVLALAFQDLWAPDLDGELVDPPSTFAQRAELIRSAYPELGYYWSVRPEWSEVAVEPSVSDALDDLTDILRDVDEALWLAEHQGWREGMWQAHWTWEFHAGAHLVDLRAHLYRLRWFGY